MSKIKDINLKYYNTRGVRNMTYIDPQLYFDVVEKNEKLNNIINELEKEFDKELENLVYREEKLYTQGIHDTIINHKHLLQELKGSDK